MALEKQEKEIREGLTIRTQMLPAIPAFKLSVQLGKIVSPALGKAQGFKTGSSIADMAPIFGEFFDQIDEKDLGPLVLKIFASSSAVVPGADGQPRIVPLTTENGVNTAFEGHLDDLIAALWFVLTVNYAGFISAALAKYKASAAPPDSPPPTVAESPAPESSNSAP